jgi:hypothetical protein
MSNDKPSKKDDHPLEDYPKEPTVDPVHVSEPIFDPNAPTEPLEPVEPVPVPPPPPPEGSEG